MERPKLYPQSLPTEVSWRVQLQHSPPRSRRLKCVRVQRDQMVRSVSRHIHEMKKTCLRLRRGFNRPRRQLQLSKPPWLLPAQPAVRVGDPGPIPFPGSDPRLFSGCGGTDSLPVRLARGAGAGRAELRGHQVGHESLSDHFSPPHPAVTDFM